MSSLAGADSPRGKSGIEPERMSRRKWKRTALVLIGFCLIGAVAAWYYYRTIAQGFEKSLGPVFKAVFADNPDLVYGLVGRAAMDEKRYAEAVTYLQQAIEKAPNDPVHYVNLGRAYSAQRAFEKAIAEFQKALELNPGYAPAHVELGVALLSSNKKQEGIEELRRFEETVRPEDRYDEDVLQRIHRIVTSNEQP